MSVTQKHLTETHRPETMNLLVTGGAGFIGSHLIRRLINEANVGRIINLDALTYAGHLSNVADVQDHPKYAFANVDLRDKPAVLGVVQEHAITHVLHLAAESHVDRSITGPDDFVHTNVVGTFHLLEACRHVWGMDTAQRQFVQVSTDEVYGSLGPTGHFAETSPYAPNSPYSASKAAGDMFVRAYGRTYGLPFILTNCCNNYGPYQHPEKLVPVVIQSVIRRQPIPVYGDGLHVRDWLCVTDHVDALWRILTRGRCGETYNIGASSESSNLNTVELICDLCDEAAPQLGGGSRELITFVEDRPGHDRRYAIDATKIRTELGWAPAYDLKRGLQETVAWYLANQEWVQQVRP